MRQANSHLWLIDCGKGFDDIILDTAKSPKLPDGRILNEAEFSCDLANRIIRRCEEHAIKARILENAQGKSEKWRADTANEYLAKGHNCILLSLRLNRSHGSDRYQFTKSSGVSAYYFQKDQSFWSWVSEPLWSISNKPLARLFLEFLRRGTRFNKRGIKKNKHPLLKHLKMPGVLLRCGFINNEQEAQKLLDDDIREEVARNMVKAMLMTERLGLDGLESMETPSAEFHYKAANIL